MVQFKEVDINDLPNFKEGRRGRVSYPILKTFLERNVVCAMLDRTGIQQSMQSLTSCLNSYVKNHALPIKIFQRSGDLYLLRTDTDENGQLLVKGLTVAQAEKNKQAEVIDEDDPEAVEITADEVASRFAEEKGQFTK